METTREFTEQMNFPPTESIWNVYGIVIFLVFFFFVSFELWYALLSAIYHTLKGTKAILLERDYYKNRCEKLEEEKRERVWGHEPESISYKEVNEDNPETLRPKMSKEERYKILQKDTPIGTIDL